MTPTSNRTPSGNPRPWAAGATGNQRDRSVSTGRGGLFPLHLLAGLVLLVSTSLPVLADDIFVSRIPYSDVLIMAVDDGVIIFMLRNQMVRKDLSEVYRIVLKGRTAFNQAESELASGKYDQAVKSYKKALSAARGDWEKPLIEVRMEFAVKRQPPGGEAAEVRHVATCRKCMDKGSSGCPACQGKRYAKCQRCQGGCLLPCTSCKGEWRVICTSCRGWGYLDVPVTTVRDARVAFRTPCEPCGSDGTLSVCPGCKEGKTPCAGCVGTGFSEKCGTCEGRGKVPCVACMKGKALPPFVDPSAPRVSKTTPELASSNAFVTFLDSFPRDRSERGWSAARRVWGEKLKDLQGEGIKLTLDVESVGYKDGYVLLRGTFSDKLFAVGLLEKGPGSELANVGKGSRIIVLALVKDFYIKKNGKYQSVSKVGMEPNEEPFGIEMENARVVEVLTLVRRTSGTVDR